MPNYDVDAVVLWVDGSDPAWLAEKRRVSGKTAEDADTVNRYRDWGLMKYWFRALEKFAPWIRTVHFVTWGHLPDFLNTQAPRLHIVKHTDYIPPEYLPTFSSHTLEMNIHRIPGLAERFVYFNDDMFLTRPLAKGAFFNERSGLPCGHFLEMPSRFVGAVYPHQIFAANNVALINKHFSKRAAPVGKYFGRRVSRAYPMIDNVRTLTLRLMLPEFYAGFKIFHAPAAYLISTFQTLWEKEPETLAKTCGHRFREATDVNQWLALWWQLASDQFSPWRMDNLVADITGENIGGICESIEGQRHDMICINDPSGDIDFEALSSRLIRAFDALLPEKCAFEK